MEAALTVESVYKTFDAEVAPVRALRGASLWLEPGEFCAVTGPSGCGKSTLLNVVAGLDEVDEGTITIGGIPVTGQADRELATIRRQRTGIVFQFFNLLESMTALDNVAMPLLLAGASRRQARRRAQDMLGLLGLAHKADDRPTTLSGGQRQRLAIARALVNEPTVLLADEPTGALDSASSDEILELFRRLHAGGQTILLVTHHGPVAEAADRIVTMRDGRLPDSVTGASSS